MTGTQISDMTISATIPEGGYVPFVITSDEPGFSLTSNYIYDLGTDLLTRVSYTALAAPAGAGRVGKIGGGTVQDHIDDLASSIGSTMVGFLQSGTGAVLRKVQDKGRENVTPGDYTGGLEVALSAVRNTDDPSFSGAVFTPNGIEDIPSPVVIPQTFSRIAGNGGGTYRQLAAASVFDGSAAAHVGNNFSNFRTFGGTHVFDISTVGEIASNIYRQIVLVSFTGDAWRFPTGGVTSTIFSDFIADAPSGQHGIYSGGGINNDNRIRNGQFLNLTKPAVKTLGLTQGLDVDARVEGNGQAAESVYDLSGAIGVRISGWHETHHEYLLRLSTSGSTTGDDGVLFDGLIDIGAKDGVGVKASLFDVGTRRVAFGFNYFYNATNAPERCFVYGVNKNLLTDASVVHTRDIVSSKHVIAKKRSFVSVGDQTFSFLHLTRGDDSNVLTNQQVFSATMVVTLSGFDGGGFPRWGVWEVEIAVHAIGNTIDDPNSSITTTLLEGNLGAITLTVEKSGAVTSTEADLQMIFTGVNTGLNNYCQYEMNVRNMSSTEAGRFVVDVL